MTLSTEDQNGVLCEGVEASVVQLEKFEDVLGDDI